MSKRNRNWEEGNKDKKARIDRIESFWKKHYKFPANENSKLVPSEVYELFVHLYR